LVAIPLDDFAICSNQNKSNFIKYKKMFSDSPDLLDQVRRPPDRSGGSPDFRRTGPAGAGLPPDASGERRTGPAEVQRSPDLSGTLQISVLRPLNRPNDNSDSTHFDA